MRSSLALLEVWQDEGRNAWWDVRHPEQPELMTDVPNLMVS